MLSICDINLLNSFLFSYILLGLEDFDFSDIIDSLGLHNKSIGDPGNPKFPQGGPDPNPFMYCSKLNLDNNDSSGDFHNNLSVQVLKDSILYNNVWHDKTRVIDIITSNNNNIPGTATNEMLKEKLFLL